MAFSRHQLTRILTIFMTLSLLVQAQAVMACQMLEVSEVMAASECCCHEGGDRHHAVAVDAQQLPCCDVTTELSLKQPEPHKHTPTLPDSTPEPSAPLWVVVMAALWLTEAAPAAPPTNWPTPDALAAAGSGTYLTTHRLRI